MSDPDDLQRVLVLGDLSGRASFPREPETPLSKRPTPRVDRDEFEARMRDAGIAVLPRGAEDPLHLASLDDLEPDGLVAQVPELLELARMRASTSDPAALAELHGRLVGSGTREREAVEASDAAGSEPFEGGLLDAALEATEAPSGPTGICIVDAAIEDAMRGHRLPPTDPRRAEIDAVLDDARDAALRRLLADPALRGVESAWRSVERLVFGLDSDRGAAVHLMDATPDECDADIAGAGGLEASGLWRRLVDGSVGSPGAARWRAIVLLRSFGRSDRDAALLGRWAKLAEAAGAALFADARPDLLDASSWTAAAEGSDLPEDQRVQSLWAALRTLPFSRRVALCGPGPLDRMPYGSEGRGTDLPGFEELASEAGLESLAWGHAGAVAALACLDAAEGRPDFRPEGTARLNGMPLAHLSGREGRELAPTAEGWVDDRLAERMNRAGLTPLRAVRGEPSVLIGPVRSLSSASPALAWGDAD